MYEKCSGNVYKLDGIDNSLESGTIKISSQEKKIQEKEWKTFLSAKKP